MGNYMQTYFLSYICWWIVYQITWCTHRDLHNPTNVFINLKKGTVKSDQSSMIMENIHRYFFRNHYQYHSRNHTTNLPLCWPVTKILNVNESLPIAISMFCKKLLGQTPLSFGHINQLQTSRGFAEQGWGWCGVSWQQTSFLSVPVGLLYTNTIYNVCCTG